MKPRDIYLPYCQETREGLLSFILKYKRHIDNVGTLHTVTKYSVCLWLPLHNPPVPLSAQCVDRVRQL